VQQRGGGSGKLPSGKKKKRLLAFNMKREKKKSSRPRRAARGKGESRYLPEGKKRNDHPAERGGEELVKKKKTGLV